MARMADGDRTDPLVELYGRYARPLYGLGIRMLGDRGMAEELVQDTFVRLWRSCTSFDPSRGSVQTFVYTLARRAAIDLRRRRASTPMDFSAEEQEHLLRDDARDVFHEVLVSLDLRDALGALSEKHREVLLLHYDGDLTQQQIAARLRVPVGTVKTRMFYALRALKLELEERDLV